MTLTATISAIRGHQSDFTALCDYMVFNRQIWIRSRTPSNPRTFVNGDLVHNPNALEWHLFEGLGIPYDKSRHSLLQADEGILEISVSSSVVIAVSNLRRIFIYKPSEKTRPTIWYAKVGSPRMLIGNTLYLPHGLRDWTFCFSMGVAPNKRLNLSNQRPDVIHPTEIHEYYEDAQGVRRECVSAATIFVLLADGQRIVYWDTGLAPSFSRGFLVPEGMQGQSISAAGSIVFLSALDAQQRLRFFTRLINYEINGGCPGVKDIYTGQTTSLEPADTVPRPFGEIGLPLEGWREHSTSNILQNLTFKIGIHLIAQGNTGRQLRIQGYHPEFGWGFYFKHINNVSWQFSNAFVEVASRFAYSWNPQVSSLLKDYNGERVESDNSQFLVALRAFHPFSSEAYPCFIELTVHENGRVHTTRLKVHVADGWGLESHGEYDEDLIGTVDGEPKALIGTLVCTQEQINMAVHTTSPLGVVIAKYFLKYHGQSKAVRIMADNCFAMFHFEHGPKFLFTRALTSEELFSSFYVQIALRPELQRVPTNALEKAYVLSANQHMLKNLKKFFRKHWKDNFKYALLDGAASFLSPLAKIAVKLLPDSDPKKQIAAQAVKDVKPLFKLHAEINYAALTKPHPGYEYAKAILKRRIDSLTRASYR